MSCLCLHSSPVHARAPGCRVRLSFAPQFSHIPVFVGLGRECPPASGHGVVEVLSWTHVSGGCRRQLSPASWEVEEISCYCYFLTMTAVGSVHLFHDNKFGSGSTPNCILSQDPRTEISSCYWVGIQIPFLYNNSYLLVAPHSSFSFRFSGCLSGLPVLPIQFPGA